MTRLSAIELPPMSPAAAVRVVRALGAHRYVAERLHDVHAFVFEAAHADDALTEAKAWASSVLTDPDVDRNSKDPRLVRRATDKELTAALAAYWGEEPHCREARERLRALLADVDVTPALGQKAALFDERFEDDLYPVLLDATWKLLPLASLDHERHRGVLESYDELELASARFEEANAVPPREYLFELPLFGARELLSPEDEWGDLATRLVLWSSVEATYEDYLVRGILRSAKVAEPE
jgi:hypothetical protein